ncbi:MAG: hypothetical protein H6631_16120, partial [Anaerolineaceae bacterium]|nr:hypothetical protein [Anaerolineaceae bacterium]
MKSRKKVILMNLTGMLVLIMTACAANDAPPRPQPATATATDPAPSAPAQNSDQFAPTPPP